MQQSLATNSNRKRTLDHQAPPNRYDSDIDDSIYTSTSTHIHRGPLHQSNIHGATHSSQLPSSSSNVLRSTRTTNTPSNSTPAGETSMERTTPASAISAVRPAAAFKLNTSNHNSHNDNKSNSNNEYDQTLTYHDEEDCGHVQNGFIHPVRDDHDDDAVSVLSDDNIFDRPTHSAYHYCCCCCCIRNSRTLVCVQLLICISIIISIIVAGVCSSGNCGTTSNPENANATSPELCNDAKTSPSCQQQPSSPPFATPTTAPVPIPTYTAFTSTQELYDAVDEYFVTGVSNPQYGPTIGSWNISLLTNLSHVFNAYDRNPLAMYFNENLSGWDTSRVTTMEKLFFNARAFNGDISTWQTGNVQNMFETFGRAISFNGDISNWDVSKVTTMARMCESIFCFRSHGLCAMNV